MSHEALDDALLQLRRFWGLPQVQRHLRSRLDPGVDLGHYRALRAIEILGAAPAVKDVAALLEVDRSTASRLVEQVVAAGYVDRVPSSEDRRRSELRLTRPGGAALEHLRGARVDLLRALTDDWSSARIERFVAAADDLLAAVDAVLPEDDAAFVPAGSA